MDKPKIGRREFFIYGIPAFAGMLYGAYKFNPDFFNLAYHSLVTGKASKDISEIIQSRLAQMTDVQLFNLDEPISYNESWMKNVCESSSIHILKNGTNIGFFDITNTCKAKPVKETLSGDKTYFSLGQTLVDGPPSITLPNPIYKSTDQKYSKFSLFAGHSTSDGNFDARASSQNKPSPYAGGLVIADGKAIITTPKEFKTFYDKRQNTNALVQYGFVVDSATLDTDLDDIKGVDTLKNQAYTGEFANCLVTLYTKQGEMKTFLTSIFSPFNESSKTFGQKPQELNIIQMIDLVNKFAINNDYKRFVVAFPDPSVIGSCVYTPIHYKLDEVKLQLSNDYIEAIRNIAIHEEGGSQNVSLFRTLGPYSDLIYPNETLPFVVTSSRSDS